MATKAFDARLKRVEKTLHGGEAIVRFRDGSERAVRCADPCLLFVAFVDRRWYGKENVSPEREGEQKYGRLLDLLQAENVEGFESSDQFLQMIFHAIISAKGAKPLCKETMKTEPEYRIQ